MELPFNLQRLPTEALDMLRLLGKQQSATAAEFERSTGLSARVVGKAIRRMVNLDVIELSEGRYRLTTDGTVMVRQLADYDAAMAGQPTHADQMMVRVARRLTVVSPRIILPSAPTDIFIGVNPPAQGAPTLDDLVRLEVRINAVGAVVNPPTISLSVPPHSAAAPGKITVTPNTPGRAIRLRVDVFQALDDDLMQLAPLGGMYFDIQVALSAGADDPTMRAVGMELQIGLIG
ncbi:MAG: hypothetical protein OHK0023_23240 [Anaerolineae bacterium]